MLIKWIYVQRSVTGREREGKSLKLAIFGATGRTGLPLVQQALEAGHSVAALVRTPAKMTIQNANLTLIQGDSLNSADVEKTVQGADAVLSVLGQSKGASRDLQKVSIRNIIAAMQKYGAKRLISLTGAGVDAPEDRPGFSNHLIKFALKTLSVLQPHLAR